MDEPVKGPATIRSWLAMPIEPAARATIDRISAADDVVHIAVMPDVHVAADVCIGVAIATSRLVYPAAVGGDIGCGMLAVAFDAPADRLAAAEAGAVLRAIGERIPTRRRHRAQALPLPAGLEVDALSHPALRAAVKEDARTELGTLGGGNHFVELQADGDGRLWLMIHSGSRGVGQAVKAHHLARATIRSAGLAALDTDAPDGAAYLADQTWARRFAEANRCAMADEVAEILRRQLGVEVCPGPTISCDHNHVAAEPHFGRTLLVHRKGAMHAPQGGMGVLPGSMGTRSFHVRGKGTATALCSAAHGAGRLMSRHAARERFGRADVRRQMRGVWFDPRRTESFRDETPGAYKDVRKVLAAQADLVPQAQSQEK